ncbi:MAG TPA: NAD-dependent epimerase/dehydratase family protein, partial [Vicinamibacterales bacterium]|nr:NAD-dependent epimerase/dehydratase family protein [Vicinamibacterales bacterium]
MKVVIAGGTGFLGRPLALALAAQGHTVVVLTRGASATRANGIRVVPWTPDGDTGAFAREIDGADAVVNLAGE